MRLKDFKVKKELNTKNKNLIDFAGIISDDTFDSVEAKKKASKVKNFNDSN